MSCGKQDEWLDVKSNKADIIPSTLKDFQALLDNSNVMNANYPGLGIIGSDNFYLPYKTWQLASNASERNAYLWLADIYEGDLESDWRLQYQKVNYTNVVLDGLNEITPDNSNRAAYDNIKGSALFYRALVFHELAVEFSLPYTAENLQKPGIIIRMETDVNVSTKRSNIQDTYQKIIGDLEEAANLLPDVSGQQTRPSKLSVYALMARIYLSMGDYAKAFQYADAVLKKYSVLLDYNTISAAPAYPFPTYLQKNPEIIFYASAVVYGSFLSSRMQVAKELFDRYQANDLRKSLFYRSTTTDNFYRGYYTGVNASIFAGLATNEIYLIRAEAAARMNQVSGAMSDLNTLLRKRWKNGTPYTDLTATDEMDALRLILVEKRKELPFTGTVRWQDLRRLNMDSRFAITLTRDHNGTIYSIAPQDKRYVYPIPDTEILLNDVEQNER